MKILMALMGLEIGGAETHVVELAKELKKIGHSVAVVSSGGAYCKDIEEAGIKHYYAPLNTRKFSDMLESYNTLKNVIALLQPDVVHAHARIPALLCHLINKQNKSFKFVTTVHGMFNPEGLMGKLTRWGSRQLVVSEDLKRYLLQNYKQINEQDITVSVNGISTERFSPDVDGSSIIEEFGLNEKARRMVYVSRLDHDVCAPAFKVLEILPRLLIDIPDVEFLIAGDGDAVSALQEKANAINKSVGRKVVVFTGPRTDVEKINACATFCIGISRAILEAMSMAKPVVLAGAFGYMGIFNEEKLSTAINNNFTCRVTNTLTAEALYNDVLALFKMNGQELEKMGEYSREVVLEHYSSRRMAIDNIKMYKSALKGEKYDVSILGYYGFRNSGDDNLLHAIINSLKERKEDININVFSKNPEETAKIYGVNSVNRFDFMALRKALKNTKLFIMGGGSLLQDGTSLRSLIYYAVCIGMAKKLCEKTMLYANGVGPFVHELSKSVTARALKGVNIVTLRDLDSAMELKNMGVYKNVYITADPVFSLNESLRSGENILWAKGITKGEKYICVSPRKWDRQPEHFAEGFAGLCDYIYTEYGYKVVFLPMQYPYDARIIRGIQSKMKSPSVFLDSRLSAEEILSVIKGSEFVVGVRLHLLIYAAAVSVPGIGIVYDPKVSGFQRYIGQPYYIEPRSLTAGDFTAVIDDCIKNREETVTCLMENSKVMREKSEETADIAIKLIKG